MCSGIADFYKSLAYRESVEYIPGQKYRLISHPLSRLDFLLGAEVAVPCLVKAVALSVFSVFIFLWDIKKGQEALLNGLREIVTYLGAIPIGILGVICPHTVNEAFLHLPSSIEVILPQATS